MFRCLKWRESELDERMTRFQVTTSSNRDFRAKEVASQIWTLTALSVSINNFAEKGEPKRIESRLHWVLHAYQIDYNYYRLTRRGCGCTVEPCAVFVCTTISDTKVQCYFTSTETVWLGTGNPHPRFNVVTFTGTVWSISDKKDRSKVQCYFTSIETIWLGTGSPDPLPLSHRSWALSDIKF